MNKLKILFNTAINRYPTIITLIALIFTLYKQPLIFALFALCFIIIDLSIVFISKEEYFGKILDNLLFVVSAFMILLFSLTWYVDLILIALFVIWWYKDYKKIKETTYKNYDLLNRFIWLTFISGGAFLILALVQYFVYCDYRMLVLPVSFFIFTIVFSIFNRQNKKDNWIKITILIICIILSILLLSVILIKYFNIFIPFINPGFGLCYMV